MRNRNKDINMRSIPNIFIKLFEIFRNATYCDIEMQLVRHLRSKMNEGHSEEHINMEVLLHQILNVAIQIMNNRNKIKSFIQALYTSNSYACIWQSVFKQRWKSLKICFKLYF